MSDDVMTPDRCAAMHAELCARMATLTEETADKAVAKTFLMIGIDVNDPIKAQEQFAAMRDLAALAKSIRSNVVTSAITVIVGAVLLGIVDGRQTTGPAVVTIRAARHLPPLLLDAGTVGDEFVLRAAVVDDAGGMHTVEWPMPPHRLLRLTRALMVALRSDVDPRRLGASARSG